MKNRLLMKRGVIASHILKLVMVILLFMAIWERDWLGVSGCILALLICLIPTILKRNFNISLPCVLDFMIAVALFVHIAGGVFNAYHTIPYYDDIAHFVSSALVALLAFVVIYILDEYWEGLHMDKYAMAFVVVIFAMAMGVLWEFLEWSTDLMLGTQEQWGLMDTMTDLLIDTIGGMIMAVGGVHLIKRGKVQDITNEFGKQIDSTIIHRKK